MHETGNTADRAARLRRLQALFLEEALEEMAELGRILGATAHDNDPATDDGRLRKIVHDLRGAGGSYGFADLSDAAGALEDAILEGAPQARVESLARDLCETVRAAHGIYTSALRRANR